VDFWSVLLGNRRRPWERFADRWLFPFLLARLPGIEVADGILVKGWPRVDIAPTAKVSLGASVTLNSRNPRYHANLHSRVKLFAERAARIEIGASTRIHGTCLHALERITIGKGCLIAGNSQIFDSNGHDLAFPEVEKRLETKGTTEPVMIGDHVWIGLNCIVLPGVTIGEGTVVGAGSVVTRDLPPFTVAGGNPARVLKDFSELRRRSNEAGSSA